MLLLTFFIVFTAILYSGFFSGIEIAFFSISEIKLQSLSKRKYKNLPLLLKLKENPDRVLITILICNNLVNIGSSSIVTYLITAEYGSGGVGIATGLMTLAILTFGEIIPKSIATRFAVPFALKAAKALYFLQIVFFPLVWIFEQVSKIPRYLIKTKSIPMTQITDEDVASMATLGFNQGEILEYERDIITNILKLNDTPVQKIMTANSNITKVSADLTLLETVKKLEKKHYSRIPIFKKNESNIVGFIFLRDILATPKTEWGTRTAESISRTPLIVKETELAHTVYKKLLKHRTHLVIVLDKKKNLVGMLTLEDIIEEVLGEIYDETDPR